MILKSNLFVSSVDMNDILKESNSERSDIYQDILWIPKVVATSTLCFYFDKKDVNNLFIYLFFKKFRFFILGIYLGENRKFCKNIFDYFFLFFYLLIFIIFFFFKKKIINSKEIKSPYPVTLLNDSEVKGIEIFRDRVLISLGVTVRPGIAFSSFNPPIVRSGTPTSIIRYLLEERSDFFFDF